jgi:transposase
LAATRRAWFEPAGPYRRAFVQALAKAGLPLVRVNPRQARRFAEATGKLAKTDRLDAALLARMGEASEMPFRCGGALLAIEPRPARSKDLAGLKELHGAREARAKDRTLAKNRAKNRTLTLLKRRHAQHLRSNAGSPPSARPFPPSSKPMLASRGAFALLIEMPWNP